MSERRSLPKSRLARVAQLARLGAGTGLGLVSGKSAEAIAEQATVVLGSLRGLAAKVGQMASTVEGILPESIEGPVAEALAKLRDHTDTSPYPEVVEVIERELGAPMNALFRGFEPTPMASASIGQVHRARLVDGRTVAVKVQHPGIERAMNSDLSNVRLLERLAASLIPKGFDVDSVFDEVSARLREELDYRIEAANQARLSKLHEATPGVRIPLVIASHSTRRVLTSLLHEGRPFDAVVREASSSERLEYATTLWRFVFRSILVGGEFNADPHPGNYIFGVAPEVTFLDFGCVQRLSEPRRLAARAVHDAAVRRDESSFADAVRVLLGTKPGPFESYAIAFSRLAFEPIFASPYRIKPDLLRRVFSLVNETKSDVLRRRVDPTPFPPELGLVNRLQFGFYSLLSRLDVEVDYAALDREILAE